MNNNIPKYTRFVKMNDKFMSGWGLSIWKTNKLVFLCETDKEAYTVYKKAKQRDEMQHVNICVNKPVYVDYSHIDEIGYTYKDLFVQIKTKENSWEWYK